MISIIIPNHNGRGHLEQLLPTIAIQTMADFEVLLVDNASADSSVEASRDLYPEIRTVELPENMGFASACNYGVGVARGDILFFLNSDTVLDGRCLELCRKVIESHHQSGFFQPKIVQMSERDKIDSAGDLLPKDGRPVSRALDRHTTTPLDERIISPCGAASLWRREIFERLGGFEESFFAYLEDVDLGLRATLAGIKGTYIPDAVVYHKGAGSASEASYKTGAMDRPETVRWIARNKIWLWARCLPVDVLAICSPWLIMGLVKSAAHHTFRSGAGHDFRRGTFEGIAGIKKALSARRRIQKDRVVTSREILRWMKQTSPW